MPKYVDMKYLTINCSHDCLPNYSMGYAAFPHAVSGVFGKQPLRTAKNFNNPHSLFDDGGGGLDGWLLDLSIVDDAIDSICQWGVAVSDSERSVLEEYKNKS